MQGKLKRSRFKLFVRNENKNKIELNKGGDKT